MKNEEYVRQHPRRAARGFSLIELVVTMLIVGILAAIAVPAYSNYVRKSRRTEAKTALLDLASLEERLYTTQYKYSSTSTDLGYSGSWPISIGSGYYQIAAPSVPTPAAGTPATFSLTATAIGDQAKDTQCASFTVTSAGVQSSLNSAAVDSTQTCWR